MRVSQLGHRVGGSGIRLLAMPTAGPLVSVGVPVYNGSLEIARALDSVLAQTYANLEIVVSDNASTDDTLLICRDRAATDRRIVVHSATMNHGATWNFNEVARRSTGEYFMWLAHDDLLEPEFVARALARLEADTRAAICHSIGQPFNSSGILEGQSYVGWVIEAPEPRVRYRQLLEHWELHAAVYGLMRREALVGTRGLRPVLSGEVVFMAEMALHGKVVQVPEVLQFKRVPDEGVPYRTPLEMRGYLTGTAAGRRRILLQRLHVSIECVRGVVHARLGAAATRRLVFDTFVVYARRRYWAIDAKECVEALLGPARYSRLRRRVRRSQGCS